MSDNPLPQRVLYFIRGTLSDGQLYYAYMAVEATRLHALKAAERQGNFQLADYGEVLTGEIGTDTPSLEVQATIERLMAEHALEEHSSGDEATP